MTSTTNNSNSAAASPVRRLATLVAIVFILVGILGFIPGITTHFSDMTFAGHNSSAKLLGVFKVSVLHNIVHLLFGIVGLALARTVSGARSYLIGGGIVYLVLTVYGAVIDQMTKANFVPINTADNWLHLVLGLGMIALGLIAGRRAVDSRRGARV